MTQPIFHSTRVTSKCESAFAGVHRQLYIDREGANANEGDVPFHACKRVPHPFTNAVEVCFAAFADLREMLVGGRYRQKQTFAIPLSYNGKSQSRRGSRCSSVSETWALSVTGTQAKRPSRKTGGRTA